MTKPLVFNYKDHEELRAAYKELLVDNQTLMADNRKLRQEVTELKQLNDGYVKIIAKNQETNNKLMASVQKQTGGDLISRAEVHKTLSLLATEGGTDAKMLLADAHEFIDALPSHNWTRVDNPNYSESELDEAFFMAIEALSADTVSREDTVTLNSPISIQADMVSVVRCKDCRFSSWNKCSHGERKDK